MSASTTSVCTFAVRPVPPSVCAELRAVDDAGSAPELVVDTEGGSPLRCCLSVSRPGETVMLVSYAPLLRWAAATGADPGPYLERGPVFLHAERCPGPADTGYPSAYRGWSRVLRAYDANGRLVGGEMLAAGDPPEPLIDRLFADDKVAFLHGRAPVPGCFTFWVDRERLVSRD